MMINVETIDAGAEFERLEKSRASDVVSAPAPQAVPAVDSAEPAPQRCSVKEAAVARRVDCLRSTECLSVASRRNWPAFSCTGCGAYVAPSITDVAAGRKG